jgi:hypothetical protein
VFASVRVVLDAAAGLASRLATAIGLLAGLLLTLPAVLAARLACLLVRLAAAPLAFITGALVALRRAAGIALRGVAVGHGMSPVQVRRLATA